MSPAAAFEFLVFFRHFTGDPQSQVAMFVIRGPFRDQNNIFIRRRLHLPVPLSERVDH